MTDRDTGVIDVRWEYEDLPQRFVTLATDQATTQQAWSMWLDGVFTTEEVSA